jgi:hypothetical protein
MEVDEETLQCDPSVRLNTPGMDKIREVAGRIGLEIVGCKVPDVASSYDLLSRHCSDSMDGHGELTSRFIAAPTEPIYNTVELSDTLDGLRWSMEQEAGMTNVNHGRRMTYKRFGKLLMPAGLIGVEEIASVDTRRVLRVIPGTNVPGRRSFSQRVESSLDVRHHIYVYPDVHAATLARDTGKKAVKINGVFFKPARAALTGPDTYKVSYA